VVGFAGQVSGEEAMMAEIATRGPIACGICVTPQFEAYAGGIYKDTQECTTEMHVIAVEGYGEENGTPYWLGRNRCVMKVMCFERPKVGHVFCNIPNIVQAGTSLAGSGMSEMRARPGSLCCFGYEFRHPQPACWCFKLLSYQLHT